MDFIYFILRILEEPGFDFIVLMVAVCAVGSSMVPRNYCDWPSKAAAGAFVLYSGYGVITFDPAGAGDLVWIVFRGLLAGGLAAGVSGIWLGIYGFINDYGVEPIRKSQRARRERERCEEERRRFFAETKRSEAPVREPPKPREPSAEEKAIALRKQVEEAYRVFETECSLIDRCELAADKAKARKRYAEQKLDNRLEELLK